jgi:hypothetical protein
MKRIIKNYNSNNIDIVNIPINSDKLHPITLNWINKQQKPTCITKPYFADSDMLNLYKEYNCNSSNYIYKNTLHIPPIGITSNDILHIYRVESIDSLLLYINDNIQDGNIININRIVNSWIRINYDTIKIYNNFLEKIYKKLIDKYLSSYNKNKIINDEINIDKEIKYYIDYWTTKHNSSDFELNLLEDLISYFVKKFNLTREWIKLTPADL